MKVLKKAWDFIIKHNIGIGLVLSFMSGIIIGGFGLALSYQAGNLSKISTAPYFEISASIEDSQQNGYILHNQGGYIQDAKVVIQGIIGIHVSTPLPEDFYFNYQTLEANYSNVKDNDITIDLLDSELGMCNWSCNTNQLINSLVLELENIEANCTVQYMEHLTLQYMDSSRAIHEEHYLIGRNDDETLFLSLISEDLDQTIHDQIHNTDVLGHFTLNDTTSIDVGYSGSSGGGRGFSASQVYIYKVFDIIKKYLDSF